MVSPRGKLHPVQIKRPGRENSSRHPGANFGTDGAAFAAPAEAGTGGGSPAAGPAAAPCYPESSPAVIVARLNLAGRLIVDFLNKYASQIQGITRIVIGLLFLEHGLNKVIHY